MVPPPSPFPFPVRREGALVRIDLGRPEEGNMLTRPMVTDLSALVAREAADPGVHVIALEGRGRASAWGGTAAAKVPPACRRST